MRFICLLLFLSFQLTTVAQLAMGQWRMHVSARQAVDVAYGDGLAIAALKNGIIVFDVPSGESKIYNKQNGLSDIQTSCIFYHSGTKSFFVGYENGNIDQVFSNGSIINIPAIKIAQISGNKRINKFNEINGKIYASTGFSVVVIDPNKHEVKDTYYPSSTSLSYLGTQIIGDTLYVLHSKGVFKAKVTNPVLGNPNNWAVETKIPTPISGEDYTALEEKDDTLYLLKNAEVYGKDSVFKVGTSGLNLIIGNQFDMEIHNFQLINGKFGIAFPDSYAIFNTDLSVSNTFGNYATFSPNVRAAANGDNNIIWLADENNGLILADIYGNYRLISVEGPPKSNFFSINGQDGKFVISSGVLDRVILDYSRHGVYTMEDETWELYSLENQPLWANDIWAFGTAAINPKNENEIAVGCYSIKAMSIIKDKQVVAVYDENNSLLQESSVGNGQICVNNLEYDENGNLWMTNSFSLNPLKVVTSDGVWHNMLGSSNFSNQFISKLIIDYNGNKWMGVYNQGLVGYNDNGTLEDPSDDIIRFMTEGAGSGNLPSKNVTALGCDFDNVIWVGTESGLGILYNSSGVFSSQSTTDLTQILITYDGIVEKLLGNSFITDIEIDGGNRKWVATKESGVFLISADGQEVISNFNKDNSPMISNEVLDMEFNHKTGELFIITDNGMVSYRADASYEDADYSSTIVFPNPVKPEFKGPVTIQGIKYGSDVRITDAAGRLVYKTTSNGGTATWNLKRLTGEAVSSGVYYIWTGPTEGKGRKVGKVLVIR